MSSIAAIGNLSIDRVADGPPRPGGTVFYSAQALAVIVADARIAASCAAADRPQLVLPLEAFGLPVTWYPAETTTAYRFHYEGDSRVMIQDAVGATWSSEQAVEAAADASWIHVGALVRSDFPPQTLAALASDGRRLLIDAQGLIRAPVLGPLRTDGDIGDVLRYVEILKLNEEEAGTLVGRPSPEPLRALGVPEVILTLGSEGSLVITSSATEAVPPIEIEGPVDPTGAGDTYSAAYLTARSEGAEPLEAARRASETAAMVVFLRGSSP
ncbi:MAG: hypothetical protein H0T97_10350 [Actinobacteria bacterium]|nr:hypothetical protein [Actinomycetota bacterium]